MRPAQAAYEAFYAREGVAVTPWESLDEGVRALWSAAATAAVDAAMATQDDGYSPCFDNDWYPTQEPTDG